MHGICRAPSNRAKSYLKPDFTGTSTPQNPTRRNRIMKTLKFPLFVSFLCFAGLSHAANLTWDGNSSAGISNVNAAWDAANVWFDGTSNVSFTAADNVTFTASGSQAYDVTTGANGPYTVGNMVFNSTSNNTTGIRLFSPGITLNGSATTAIGHTGLVQVTGVVTGAGSFTLDSGEIRLTNNSNTFSGGITLNGGTLRVGTNAGSGAPQTSGSLGTGTLTINGGTIFQNQGNARIQAVAAVIGGNFAFNSVAGGGLILGTDNAGTRTVSLGGASRTITVSENANGTGANSVLGLRDLTNTAGGAIVKEGAGVLRIQGTSTAGVTVNGGALEVTNALGATPFTMNSGTVWRRTTTATPTLGSTMVLNSASLVNADTLNNSRASAFDTLQVSGTSSVFLGQGLNIQSSGTTTGAGFNVRSGGILGGNGTIQTASTQSYASGVTTLGSLTDSVITLSAGGSIRPGTVNSLNATVGDLSFGSLIWNGEAAATAQMAFNLGLGNTSDTINLSGALTKGTGTNFLFDFLGYSATEAALFTLFEFDSQSGFVVDDFSATNITFGEDLSGGFVLNTGSLQYQVTVIPEPGAALLGGLGLLALLRRRRVS
jgi:autotransporter-associated beta strand protein